MNGKELLSGMSYVHSKYVQEAEGVLPKHQRKPIQIRKKPFLIAAIIATASILMGAAIDALVKMNVSDVKTIVPDLSAATGTQIDVEETQAYVIFEGEKVDFDEVQDVFIELGPYYPQEIPNGYSITFVSDDVYQHQYIAYEDEYGNGIDYTIYIADPASDVEIYDISKKTNVIINSDDGILYEETNGYRTLVWIDQAQGYGFKLRTGDKDVDLLAMARSTAEGEPLVPSRADKTPEAIAELGDFCPEYLPTGFEEQGVLGSPLTDGGGWYSYVRKWYVNKTENTRIYFEYESYVIAPEDGYTDDARTVCSFFIPGHAQGIAVYEEVEVNGMFGLATENHIVWADPKVHKVFHLTSEDITGDVLLKVAQSIIENS